MDQIKTGKFIASLRKEKEMTQKQLAEKLGISDKTVSKWETGKGTPEVSLMLPLCELLNISVNELLSGERLDGEKYRKMAEENIVTLILQKSKKEIAFNFSVSIFLFIISFATIFLAAGKFVPPIIMPITFFVNILLVVANLVAGITYGIIKKWNKLLLGSVVVLNVFLICVMVVVFCMMVMMF